MSTLLLLSLGVLLLIAVGAGLVVAAVITAPDGVEDDQGFREVGRPRRHADEPAGALPA